MSRRDLPVCPQCRRIIDVPRQRVVTYTGEAPHMGRDYCSSDCLLDALQRKPRPRRPWADKPAQPRRRRDDYEPPEFRESQP